METPRRKLSFSGVKVEKSSEPKKLEKAKSTPQLDEPKASLKRLRGKTADTAVEKPEESGEPEIPAKNPSERKKKCDTPPETSKDTLVVATSKSGKKDPEAVEVKKPKSDKMLKQKKSDDDKSDDEEGQEVGKYSAGSDGPKERTPDAAEGPKKTKRKSAAKEAQPEKKTKSGDREKKPPAPKTKVVPTKTAPKEKVKPPTDVPAILRHDTNEISTETKEACDGKGPGEKKEEKIKKEKDRKAYKARKARFYRSLDSGIPRLNMLEWLFEFSMPIYNNYISLFHPSSLAKVPRIQLLCKKRLRRPRVRQTAAWSDTFDPEMSVQIGSIAFDIKYIIYTSHVDIWSRSLRWI